jgi:hypothetical protein
VDAYEWSEPPLPGGRGSVKFRDFWELAPAGFRIG